MGNEYMPNNNYYDYRDKLKKAIDENRLKGILKEDCFLVERGMIFSAPYLYVGSFFFGLSIFAFAYTLRVKSSAVPSASVLPA